MSSGLHKHQAISDNSFVSDKHICPVTSLLRVTLATGTWTVRWGKAGTDDALEECRSARRMFGPADCQSLARLRALRVFRSVSARRAVDASLETGEISAKFTSPLHQTPGESPRVCSPTPKGDGRQKEQLLLRVPSSWLVPL
ncbi:unnamed protein product [Boreogadus saida]